MTRYAPLFVALLVLLAFGGTVTWLFTRSVEEAVEVQTASPARRSLVRKTVATGSIVPRNEVELKSRVSGIIDRLYVEPGDAVTTGERVATIRIVPNPAQLANAQAGVEAARIALDEVREQLRRDQQLFDQGALSATALQAIEVDVAERELQLQSAQTTLQIVRDGASAGAGEASTHVTATLDGMVLTQDVRVGGSVIEANAMNAGTTIAVVADMDDLVFEGRVDESEVGKIREGLSITLTLGALDDQRLEGTLEHIAPKGRVVDGSVQFDIRAAIAVPDGVFVRAGSSANADIVLDRADDVLSIDQGLVQFDEERRPFVEVLVGEGLFERRDVELGLSDGLYVEVVSGLAEGELIKRPEGTAPRAQRGG